MSLSRRDFLSAAILAPAAFAFQRDARLLGTVPLVAPGAQPPPFGRLLGAGLDARQFTDLSQLGVLRTSHDAPRTSGDAAAPRTSGDADAPRTSTEDFFVRTAVPRTLPPTDAWRVRVGGLVQSPFDLGGRELEALTAPGGRYLLECSGNSDPSNFGLLSAADWDGVPLAAVLDRARPSAASARVLVSGFDEDTTTSRTSAPGASWIFTREELRGALLATRMNGAPLPRDHGFPVRLIVPGWYGCSCIKWVDRIELVADEAPATSQMQEFARRTHQPLEAPAFQRSLAERTPPPAREFIPAMIDTAAMPVRVEKWLAGGKLAYRLTGIIWGGSKPTNALAIRFKAGGPWPPVDDCPLPASTLTWSLWTHEWRPEAPGRYQIVLKVTDPSIRTRRLDLFFYVREVVIDEV